MAQGINQPRMITIRVEGLGEFQVPENTGIEEIQRRAAEFERQHALSGRDVRPMGSPPAQVSGAEVATPPPRPDEVYTGPRSLTDRLNPRPDQGALDILIDLLPEIGATVGGAAGTWTGIPTLGLGSVPGAVTGATFGGGGGEAIRQLIQRARGREAPATPGEAAGDITWEAGKGGLSEVLGQAPGMFAKAVGKQFGKGGLAQKEMERFGDLGPYAVKGGALRPEQALDNALAAVNEIKSKYSVIIPNDLVRLAKGPSALTPAELRGLGARSPSTVVSRARSELINILDSKIRDPRVIPEVRALAIQAKRDLGLALAQLGAAPKTPSAGSAALGGYMGMLGGAGAGAVGGGLLGGLPGAVLGGTVGAGVPLFLGGNPTVARGVGKALHGAGTGMRYGIPPGLRGIMALLEGPDEGQQGPDTIKR